MCILIQLFDITVQTNKNTTPDMELEQQSGTHIFHFDLVFSHSWQFERSLPNMHRGFAAADPVWGLSEGF